MVSRLFDAQDLKARIGQKQLVNPDTGEGMGFYCKESGKILRDSLSYLDHINGKKRARARTYLSLSYSTLPHCVFRP